MATAVVARPVGHGTVVAAEFRPHPLLRAAHLQTIVPTLLRPLPALGLEIETRATADGDVVEWGWFGRPAPGQPVAVLVHGLTGGFASKYLRGTARALQRSGWAGLILQLRGAGAQPNRRPRAYHQGDTEDLHAALQHLRDTYPTSCIAAVGWSLGGNVVLKAAGEAGVDFAADQVAAASVPFALEPCVARLNRGFSRIYQRRMLRDLQSSAQAKAAAMSLPEDVDLPATLQAANFRQYDTAWTAPLNGFADAADYYARCACGPYLAGIRRPTLIVHSRDDPFMTPEMIPSASHLAPQVRLEVSERGGHVGFVAAGPGGRPVMWLEQRLAHWLNASRVSVTAPSDR
ncbi:MAG: hydrolase [Oceanococcaceae bacterium]